MSPESTSTPSISEAGIKQLFARFTAIWGNLWCDRFATQWGLKLATEEWRQALDGMTPEQVVAALHYCRDHCKWPPTPAEFRKAVESTDTWEHRSPAYRVDTTPRLPRRTSQESRSLALQHLRQAREALR